MMTLCLHFVLFCKRYCVALAVPGLWSTVTAFDLVHICSHKPLRWAKHL